MIKINGNPDRYLIRSGGNFKFVNTFNFNKKAKLEDCPSKPHLFRIALAILSCKTLKEEYYVIKINKEYECIYGDYVWPHANLGRKYLTLNRHGIIGIYDCRDEMFFGIKSTEIDFSLLFEVDDKSETKGNFGLWKVMTPFCNKLLFKYVVGLPELV